MPDVGDDSVGEVAGVPDVGPEDESPIIESPPVEAIPSEPLDAVQTAAEPSVEVADIATGGDVTLAEPEPEAGAEEPAAPSEPTETGGAVEDEGSAPQEPAADAATTQLFETGPDTETETDIEPDPAAAELEAVAERLEEEGPDDDAEAAATTASAEESLDDIAPGTVAGAEAAGVEGAELVEPEAGRRTGVSIWPFVIYVGVWLALAAYAVWQFLQLPDGRAVYESQLYTYTIIGGLVLTAIGPLLILAVWLASWVGTDRKGRGGLFISSLVLGSIATVCGVIIWWGALVIVDYLRLGRPL